MVKINRTFYVVFLLFFVACSTVPITGRKQLKLIPNGQLLPMSFEQYTQVLSESELSTDEEQVAMIKRVGQKIQKAAEDYYKENKLEKDLVGYDWEYNLIVSDQVNAWCMPGGKVAFYTGILPICEDETGVAVVMGHEVAHALANHGGERMSQGMIAQMGMGTLGAAMGENPTLTKQLLLQSIGMGTQLGVLKFSRSNESEADHIGLILMAKAGYNPQAATSFWQRMAALSGGQAPPEFLSTHPESETRVNDLQALMPEALKYYKSEN
ncbi:MAG: M48 family metallopeptidase [Salibacteraceae bacterium]|nr:M48 family metallopeptidase [Salibacteraceae bacterium]|tara:strand:- start:9494 stop:10297 length:804 start_codon:yes stop_codon:yes gene_type:complete